MRFRRHYPACAVCSQPSHGYRPNVNVEHLHVTFSRRSVESQEVTEALVALRFSSFLAWQKRWSRMLLISCYSVGPSFRQVRTQCAAVPVFSAHWCRRFFFDLHTLELVFTVLLPKKKRILDLGQAMCQCFCFDTCFSDAHHTPGILNGGSPQLVESADARSHRCDSRYKAVS